MKIKEEHLVLKDSDFLKVFIMGDYGNRIYLLQNKNGSLEEISRDVFKGYCKKFEDYLYHVPENKTPVRDWLNNLDENINVSTRLSNLLLELGSYEECKYIEDIKPNDLKNIMYGCGEKTYKEFLILKERGINI